MRTIVAAFRGNQFEPFHFLVAHFLRPHLSLDYINYTTIFYFLVTPLYPHLRNAMLFQPSAGLFPEAPCLWYPSSLDDTGCYIRWTLPRWSPHPPNSGVTWVHLWSSTTKSSHMALRLARHPSCMTLGCIVHGAEIFCSSEFSICLNFATSCLEYTKFRDPRSLCASAGLWVIFDIETYPAWKDNKIHKLLRLEYYVTFLC